MGFNTFGRNISITDKFKFRKPTPPTIFREKPATLLKVFSDFSSEDVVMNMSRRVTTGMWTGNTGSILLAYTSSVQSASSGDWYYNIYNTDPLVSSSAEVQYALSYGHKTGGGGPVIDVLNTSKEPQKAIYGQYKNLLLDPEDEFFTFAGSVNRRDFYVINLQRSRLKQKMDAGNWELHLAKGNNTIKLIDDSNDNFDKLVSSAGRRFNVVSGTLNVGSDSTIKTAAVNQAGGGYGMFYPDRGLIILNPGTVVKESGLALTYSTASSSATLANNHGELYNAIVDGAYFAARNEEIVTSTHYFVRVKNRDYNFSNNPTYYTSSDGSIKQTSFIGDPRSYITTVGLYNETNELLAVGKLSQPILKSFDREALVKVKLDY